MMRELEPPNSHYLSAAAGWIGLGNLREAKAELANIDSELRDHPDVLEIGWIIAAETGGWDEALAVAQRLIKSAPERASGWLHQAYALRRATGGGLQAAWDALLPAFKMFPREPTIPYNLSCYACQLQQLDLARLWLKRAVKIGDKEHIRVMALQDPDLQPLWNEVGGICGLT